MYRKIVYLLKSFLIIILTCNACNGSKSTAEQEASSNIVFSDAEKKMLEDMNQVMVDLPPPTIVPNVLMKIGSEYDPTFTNSLDNIESYQTNEDKSALNLGIYATDVGYQIAYGQAQESLNYMTALQKLAETIGVSAIFDVSNLKSYESNLNNPDSLAALLNTTVMLAEQRLGSTDRLSMAALILSGSFIEGLYLIIKVSESYHVDGITEDEKNLRLQPLMKIILDQEKVLVDVITLIEDIESDEIIAKMLNELQVLKIIYDVNKEDVNKILAKDKNAVIVPQLLRDITKEIVRIREDITS